MTAPAVDAAPLVEVAPNLAVGCMAYATGLCSAFDRCGPEGTPLLWGDVSKCERTLERECLADALPGVSITNESLGRCGASAAKHACPVHRENDDCRAPPGKRALGERCITSAQCASRNCLRAHGTDECGTCASPQPDPPPAKARAAPGDRCVGTVECRTGSFCGDDKKCRLVTVRKEGETCTKGILATIPDGDRPCGPGLQCMESGKTTRCEKRPADGEPCTQKGPRCFFPSTCANGKCTPRATNGCSPDAG